MAKTLFTFGAPRTGSTSRRRLSPSQEAQQNLATRGQTLTAQGEAARIRESRRRSEDAKTSAEAGRKSAEAVARQGHAANLAMAGMSPDEASKYLGAGGGGAKPQKKVYDPGEARRVRSKENMLYAQGRKRYAATHPAEAQKAGKFEVQAAPNTPTLTFSGQEAAAGGQAARMVGNEAYKGQNALKQMRVQQQPAAPVAPIAPSGPAQPTREQLVAGPGSDSQLLSDLFARNRELMNKPLE